jgi:hypothetical protein
MCLRSRLAPIRCAAKKRSGARRRSSIRRTGDLKWSEQHRLGLELAFLKTLSLGQQSPGQPSLGRDFKPRPNDVAAVAAAPAPTPRPVPKPPAPVAQEKPAPAPPVAKPEVKKAEEAPGPETPVAPVEAEEASVGADVTLGDIQREWQGVLRHLKKGLNGVSTEAMAREGHPVSLSDGLLTIGFDSRHTWHKTKTQDNAAAIARAIQDVLGARLKVAAATVDGEPVPEPAVSNLEATESTEHPLLNDVMTMFDGKLVEDGSNPWEE